MNVCITYNETARFSCPRERIPQGTLGAMRKVLCQLGVLLQMVLFLTDGPVQLQKEVTPAWIRRCTENYLRMLGVLKKKKKKLKPSETGIAVCFLTH